MNRLSLIFAAIFLLFFSCEKEDLPDAPGDRIKMIRVKAGDTIRIRSFQYDDQNRLTAVVDSGHSGIYRRLITYDGQGNLLNVAVNSDVYTFDIDNDGRVIRKRSTLPGQQSATVRNSYGYDVEGKVISDSLHNNWTPDVWGVLSFVYDGNNNVIESKLMSSGGGTQVFKQCTYDNRPNPLYDESVMIYMLTSGSVYEFPIGRNNLLTERFSDGTLLSYNYEYYSNGLPKSCSLHYSSDPLVYYVDFYYE